MGGLVRQAETNGYLTKVEPFLERMVGQFMKCADLLGPIKLYFRAKCSLLKPEEVVAYMENKLRLLDPTEQP